MFALGLLAAWVVISLAFQAAVLLGFGRLLHGPRATAARAFRLSVEFVVVGLTFALAVNSLTPHVTPPPPGVGRTDAKQQGDSARSRAIVVGLLAVAIAVVFPWWRVKVLFGLSGVRAWAVAGSLLAAQAVIAVVALFVIRPYVIEDFVIPTGSSAPTIQPDDHILANKLEVVRRGKFVAYWARNHTTTYCHRLVALPGDRIRFRGRQLFINDDPKAYAPPGVIVAASADRPQFLMPYRYRDGETVTLGPDDYFAVGDNIEKSYDSRYTGPVHGSDLIGVVDLIYFPVGRWRLL